MTILESLNQLAPVIMLWLVFMVGFILGCMAFKDDRRDDDHSIGRLDRK